MSIVNVIQPSTSHFKYMTTSHSFLHTNNYYVWLQIVSYLLHPFFLATRLLKIPKQSSIFCCCRISLSSRCESYSMPSSQSSNRAVLAKFSNPAQLTQDAAVFLLFLTWVPVYKQVFVVSPGYTPPLNAQGWWLLHLHAPQLRSQSGSILMLFTR